MRQRSIQVNSGEATEGHAHASPFPGAWREGSEVKGRRADGAVALYGANTRSAEHGGRWAY